MKKVFFAAAFTALAGLALVYGVSASRGQDKKNALQLANAEVLANTETGGGSSTSWDCWSAAKAGSGGFYRCGNPCVWINGMAPDKDRSKCYQ